MIQFNLLPDVKLEYIKTRRTKRMVILASIIASAISVAVFIIMFTYVNVVQQRHLSNLDNDIQSNIAALEAIPDIDKVLTIQSQLGSLTMLHEAKPASDRILPYLGQVTPAQASVGQVSVDFEDSSMIITGGANTLATVNKFVDTLKFTEFNDKDEPQETANAFSEVVLSSFGVGDDGASYQISLKFDPMIFDNTKDIELIVPNIVSTRSETERPADLFQEVDPEIELNEVNP